MIALHLGLRARLRRVQRLPHDLLRAAWRAGGHSVLMTSVPKSGTHLVKQLFTLVGLPAEREIVAESPETPAELSAALVAARGDAVAGHVHGRLDYWQIARELDARVVFVSRDPRDQVVSHAFHFRTHRDHPLHPYFRDRVPDVDDALMAVIRGFGPGPHGHLADVATFYGYFTPWIGMEGIFHTTFERLVGRHGGGSEAVQRTEVRRLLRHIRCPLPASLTAAVVAPRVFAPSSPTFRQGRIGGWTSHFTPRHKEAFKETAGQLLIDLGYERDLAW
jgi:hypothetical protein